MALFISLFVGVLWLVPALASADACADLKAQLTGGDAQALLSSLPQYCTAGAAYTTFLNYSYIFIGVVATIAIMYGGFLYITANGDTKQAAQGRNVATYAIIGLVLVLLAALITRFVVGYLTAGL